MTLGDLARFVAAVHRREIVSPATWSGAMTPRSWVGGMPYGYGMFVEAVPGFPGVTQYSHGGDILGYSALWAVWEGMDDESSFGVAIQCNQKGSDTLYRVADDLFLLYVTGRLEPEFPFGSRGASRGRFTRARFGDTVVGVPNGVLLGLDAGGTLRTRFGRAHLEGARESDGVVSGRLDLRRLPGALRGLRHFARSWGIDPERCEDGETACVDVVLERGQ